ncbi:MAG TPA: AMP-binding protein [Baekduia sp.]|nr:AMP-binding protein [Baekduia sp.]
MGERTSENLAWPLRRAARLFGDAVAVVDAASGVSVTYTELARRVAALGAALDDELAVPPGGRVGVLAANSLAHLECFLGVPAAGRVVVSLNTRLAVEELRTLAEDAQLSVLVADDDNWATAVAIATDRHVRVGEEYEALLAGADAGAPATAALRPADLHALAAISYTGGTTGRPKGVMLSHGNLLANARHNLIATGHGPEDRWLHVCPMFHVAGTANVLAATWVGARQVVLPRFEAAAVCAAVEEHAITHAALVPTMLGMLLDHEARHPADFSSLRHVQYAASPITPDLQRRVLERFADVEVAQFYGMTEAAPTVCACTPADHRRADGTRLASMGAPVVGVEVEVRDPGTSAPVAPGEIGEVWVRGPNVMLGYWEQPDATAGALVDGWYRTGDAAYADADGYLFLVDRLKDMIISGGENVYSVEVEAVLAEHPAVVEAAVFGVPHERWGEAVHAVVSVGGDVTADELIEHCRASIAGFKVPRTIDVTTEPLPKSGAGKLLKQQLRAPFWIEHERNIS